MAVDFPVGGAGNIFQLPGIDLMIANKPYPAEILYGTEAASQWTERREISGSIWSVQNATYNGAFGGFQQVNTTAPSFAFVQNQDGSIQTMSAPAGSISPISWTRLFYVDKNGVLQSAISSSSFGPINVKNPPFNAKGDGITDDTAAFISAISYITLNGGTIFAPPGTYIISNTLVFGNGSPTSQSTIYGIGMIGSGSGGGVTTSPSPGITHFKWVGPSDRPMMSILGPIASVQMSGFLLDGNGLAQDGIWEIYMHGSQWSDIFTISVLRAHWFRTRWLTNPIGSNPFVEGSSSNIFSNCGCSSGSVTAPTGTLWGLIMGGNPNDPTDRTSNNTSDPYNSVFLKCRFRMDGANSSIAAEFRYTDSNVFMLCDFVGQYGIAVAQNPNQTTFPSAFFYSCFPAGNTFTPGGQYGSLATIGAYVNNGATMMFMPHGDFNNDPGIPSGAYFPWAGGFDVYGGVLRFSGNRPAGYTLQAIDTGAHTVTPADTSFHAFPISTSFIVKQGDLYVQGVDSKGSNIHLCFAGVINTSGTPGNIRFQVLIGSAIIADTGAIALTASQTNAPFDIDVDAFTANIVSTAATLTQQRSKMAFSAATSNPGIYQIMPLASGGSTTGVVTTSNQQITLQVSFSSTTTGNNAILTEAKYELQKATPPFIA
jgi:hypothetical protein